MRPGERRKRLIGVLFETRKEFGENKPERGELVEAASKKCEATKKQLIQLMSKLTVAKRAALQLQQPPRYGARSDADLFKPLKDFLSKGTRYSHHEICRLAPQYAGVPVRRMRDYLTGMSDETRKELGLKAHMAPYKSKYQCLLKARATFGCEKPTVLDLCRRAAASSKYKVAALKTFFFRLREKHRKSLDVLPHQIPYAELLEAAKKARKKFKGKPTFLELAKVAVRLRKDTGGSSYMTPGLFHTNFLCTALKLEDEVALDLKHRCTYDKKKVALLYLARKNFTTAKPTRIQLAKNAARSFSVSEPRMLEFVEKRLKGDDIRALDLRGEGHLSVRKKSVPGPKVHDVLEKRSTKTASKAPSSRPYNRCFVAVYKTQLLPKNERTIANVAMAAKMSEKEVEALFEKRPELLQILHGYSRQYEDA